MDLPLPLSQDEFGEIGVELVLLADALLLHAVPALFLGITQGTGNVITKVQTLLFSQVIRCGETVATHRLVQVILMRMLREYRYTHIYVYIKINTCHNNWIKDYFYIYTLHISVCVPLCRFPIASS